MTRIILFLSLDGFKKVTTMANPNQQLVGTIKKLFEMCKDSETGFGLAARHAEDAELKALLQDCAEQRAQLAAELQGELARLGAHDVKSGTIGGTLHQAFTEIKSAFTGGSDQARIAECERADAEAVKHFEEALKQGLPADVA